MSRGTNDTPADGDRGSAEGLVPFLTAHGAERRAIKARIYSDEFKASALELPKQRMTKVQVCMGLGRS